MTNRNAGRLQVIGAGPAGMGLILALCNRVAAGDPQADVCPHTGVVFFNGGLRKDARALYLSIRDGHESRVELLQMEQLDEQLELLERAGLILQAIGFAPNLPRLERAGEQVNVGNPGKCGELCDLDSGQLIPGLFGMGLGYNILPDREPGGEPSFNGGIHGFQSYPLVVAPRIIEALMANMPMEASN
ncbi:MAG: hypothetical protein GY896_00695 [Gammaproteobacteria bacterium]|nr:hypothetical protein [Gammaproteobacteria bacterium]